MIHQNGIINNIYMAIAQEYFQPICHTNCLQRIVCLILTLHTEPVYII